MNGECDNLVGKRFGRLIVIGIEDRDKNKHIKLKCKCDCGNKKVILANNVKYGKTISCGCYWKEQLLASNKRKESMLKTINLQKERILQYHKDLINIKFGRLTILRIVSKIGSRMPFALCRCDCGKEVSVRLSYLENKHTQSCGCLKIYRHPEKDVGLRKLYYRYKFRNKRYSENEIGISLDDFKTLTSQDCYYCGDPPAMVMKSRSVHSEYIYNGLDRIDSNKGYELNNVVPCCGRCNKMKLDDRMDDFVNHISKIFNHLNNGLLKDERIS